MRKSLASNRAFIIIGLLSIVFILFYWYVFFLEANGCKLEDLPQLISHPTELFNDYCGEVGAFTFLPAALNGVLSIVMDMLLWVSFATALLLPVGLVRALLQHYSNKK